MLCRLLDAARKAQSGERKMHALRRIVRRVGEPVIIFTEYRDTLDAIRDAIGGLRRLTTLHGGQTAHERRHSVRAFTNGAADVMIATDAGSEGLNLQGACRLVVNLELPWNPIRLEQRIGRVDRIGQTRTVHAINLLAEGTAERTVLASLLRRIDRIRLSEIEIAACVISRSEPPPRSVHVETRTQTFDLGIEARAAAQHIADARRSGAVGTKLREEVVPVTVIKSRDTSLISFFRVRLVTGAGRLIEDRLLPVRLPLDRLDFPPGRKEARGLAESLIAHFGPELLRRAHAMQTNARAHSRSTLLNRSQHPRSVSGGSPTARRHTVTAGASRTLRQSSVEGEMGPRRTSRRHPAGKRGSSSSARCRHRRPSGARPRARHAAHPMLAGLSGSLVSHYFAERILQQEFSGRLGDTSLAAAERSFTGWWQTQATQLGPASSIRSIWDLAAVPLVELLGFTAPSARGDGPDTRHTLLMGSSGRIALVVATWNVSLDNLWREAARRGIGVDAAWVLCTNGRELRLVDTQRTYSRAYLQFDLQRAAEHSPTFAVLWGVLREEAFRHGPGESPLVLEILRSSARHGQAVSRSLRVGVIESVQHLLGGLNKCGKHDLSRLFDESLTVVYRVLFLMFAESRNLVPNWHPVYRESYTVESLRERAERHGKVPGLWEALQAIARLAHNGCRAGSLVVPPFNGRLFSPTRSPIAESCAVDDEVARQALLSLSTTRTREAHAHRLSRPRRRTARRGVRKRARLRARVCRLEPRPDSASARRRRAQVDRLVLHAANDHRLRGAAHSASPG